MPTGRLRRRCSSTASSIGRYNLQSRDRSPSGGSSPGSPLLGRHPHDPRGQRPGREANDPRRVPRPQVAHRGAARSPNPALHTEAAGIRRRPRHVRLGCRGLRLSGGGEDREDLVAVASTFCGAHALDPVQGRERARAGVGDRRAGSRRGRSRTAASPSSRAGAVRHARSASNSGPSAASTGAAAGRRPGQLADPGPRAGAAGPAGTGSAAGGPRGRASRGAPPTRARGARAPA